MTKPKPKSKPPGPLAAGMQISALTIAKALVKPTQMVERRVLCAPVLPERVLPPADQLASDHVTYDSASSAWGLAYSRDCDLGFRGYQYLAELAQRSEYRSPAETIASEMTRKWIEFKAIGKGDKSKKISEIAAEFKRLGIQQAFRKIAELDSFFGRAQLHIRIKGQSTDARLVTPLVVSPETIAKGSLEGLTVVEPMWTTPNFYNAMDPLAPDFYKPKSWYIMGRLIHASRLLTFVAREVPDMLKPSYNFSGVSMTQLMEPYVNQWLRTRNSVSDMLHSFSISGIKTDLNATMSGSEEETLVGRAELFNALRDSRGLMLLNKDTEDFFQFNVPLSGLDSLQAQAQEHMAAPSHIPLVKLLGVTPTGLNASSAGEIAVFYDFVLALQRHFFSPNLQIVLELVQLSLYGQIDKDIGFEYVPLTELTGEALSAIRKEATDGGCALIDRGVISPLEERERLASDPNSGYNNLVVEDVPPPPEAENDDPKGN